MASTSFEFLWWLAFAQAVPFGILFARHKVLFPLSLFFKREERSNQKASLQSDMDDETAETRETNNVAATSSCANLDQAALPSNVDLSEPSSEPWVGLDLSDDALAWKQEVLRKYRTEVEQLVSVVGVDLDLVAVRHIQRDMCRDSVLGGTYHGG
jgi:hypothetical protein